MRKVVAILAFACLLFFTAGYGVLYYVRLHEIKTEMKAAVFTPDEKAFVRFTFTNAELGSLEWEDSTEFGYRGEMYDVVKIERLAGKMTVWCLDDKKETALVNNYLKFHRQSPEKNTSAFLLKFLALQFQPATISELPPVVITHLFEYPVYLSRLSTAERFILLPPPKCC